jgi:sRNA-binding carbon storage regulator CsrA
MLLLTRRIKEKLTIGDDLEITLLEIDHKNEEIKIEIYNKKTNNSDLELLTLKKFFRLNKDVTILITYIKGRQTTFAIGAPREIPIHRYEIYRKIQAGIPMDR